MSLNPYAPPMAAVADIAPHDDVAAEPPFFAVSVTKLAVMCVCTFTLYEIYWFYKNWKRIAERERQPMAPTWRALFAIIFCYSCFARMRDHEAATALGLRLNALPLAVAWTVTTLVQVFPEPYDWVSMSAFVFMLPVQQYANRLNALASPSHNRNSRFGAWNWVAVVLGGGLMLMAIAGSFLPPEA
jgi:hypothetical protein